MDGCKLLQRMRESLKLFGESDSEVVNLWHSACWDLLVNGEEQVMYMQSSIK